MAVRRAPIWSVKRPSTQSQHSTAEQRHRHHQALLRSDRPNSGAIEFASAPGISQTMKLTSKYRKAPTRVGSMAGAAEVAQVHRSRLRGSGKRSGPDRSDASHGARLGDSDAALHLLRGRQLDVHVVPLDPDREDLDLVRLAAEALPRFEREGLLVQGAGDLGDALLIAEDAAREDRLALVRADVLAWRTTRRGESNRKTAISRSPYLIARPPSRGKSLTEPT